MITFLPSGAQFTRHPPRIGGHRDRRTPRHHTTIAEIDDPVSRGRLVGGITTVALTGTRITTPLHDTKYRTASA
jgi:hypothetical protein